MERWTSRAMRARLGVFGAVAWLLGACGGDSNSGSSPNPESAPDTATSTERPATSDSGLPEQPRDGSADGGVREDTGAPGEAGAAAALYVSLSGSDKATGSAEAPLASVQAAIGQARERGVKQIRVCSGLYRENIVIEGPIHIEGSLDCKKNWQPSTTRTELHSWSGSALTVKSPMGTVSLSKIVFRAPAAAETGSSSIAVSLFDAKDVLIVDSEIFAGAGGDGFVPATPSSHDFHLPDSGDGQSHGDYYCDVTQSGMTHCERQALGGKSPTHYYTKTKIAIRLPNCVSRGEDGGLGGSIHAPNTTGSSKPGTNGISGRAGAPASAGIGQVSLGGYVAWNGGTAGTDGTSGSGGGGGSGGAESNTHNGDATICPYFLVGGGGGAGGLGGCGGSGAAGSGGGGASIGVLAVASRVRLTRVTVDTSTGGQGGDGVPGAMGQAGGKGGNGGRGSHGRYDAYYREGIGCYVYDANYKSWDNGTPGAPGGNGGQGGAGGPGGGGPSIGVLATEEPMLETVLFGIGKGGRGGRAITGRDAPAGLTADKLVVKLAP